jgi:hypothetical protein
LRWRKKTAELLASPKIKVIGSEADLLKLFVEPTMLRNGVGMKLFHWATSEAAARGADRMVIKADPDAAPFYRRTLAELH